MPVNKLVIHVSLPIMISMTIQALYNVIDSIFVAKISEDALNAVSLSFPVQNMIITASVGLAVGMNALLGRRLGEKNPEKAKQTAMNGLLLSTVGALVFFLFGLFGVGQYFASQTENPVILAYGQDYLPLVCICGFFSFYGISYERCLQATGRTLYTMIAQGVGAVVNIILDAILIFGLFGLPRMEVLGAAIATVIGQATFLSLLLYFHKKHNQELAFDLRTLRPDPAIIRDISMVGIPSMAMGLSTSLLVFGLNQILLGLSATAVAVLGIYYKVQSFVFMAIYGLNNGMVPILSYNFGAKHYERLMKTVAYGMLYGVCIATAGMLVYYNFATELITLFQEEDAASDLLEIGVPALKIISLSFPVAAFSIVMASVFQAMGHGVMSLVGTVLRQLVVLLPVAYLLSRYGGLQATWYAFPISETVSLLFFGACAWKVYQGDILPLKSGELQG